MRDASIKEFDLTEIHCFRNKETQLSRVVDTLKIDSQTTHTNPIIIENLA